MSKWWILLFPFNLIILALKMLNRQSVCRHCNEDMLLALQSPIGSKLVNSLNADISEESLARMPAHNKEITTPETSSSAKAEIQPEIPRVAVRKQDPNDW